VKGEKGPRRILPGQSPITSIKRGETTHSSRFGNRQHRAKNAALASKSWPGKENELNFLGKIKSRLGEGGKIGRYGLTRYDAGNRRWRRKIFRGKGCPEEESDEFDWTRSVCEINPSRKENKGGTK